MQSLRHSFVASLITLCFSPSHTRHTLLQFINVMNFRPVEPLLHFFPNSVVNRVQKFRFELL